MTPVEFLRAYTAAAIRLWNRLDDEAWQTFRDGGPLDEQEAWAAGLEALHALDELLEVSALSAAQAAIALVRDGATIAEAADQAGLPRGEALQAVMADYRTLVKTAHATKATNGHATLDHWLHHPDRRVVEAAEQLRDLTQRIEQNAALTAERQLLVERLAEVDKQLGTLKRPRKQQTPRPCPHCDRILPNAQGLAVHVKAKHQDAS